MARTESGNNAPLPGKGNATVAPRAIVLLSGGLDSATCLSVALHEGYEPYALSFDYGQRHRAAELAAACNLLRHCGIPRERHRVVDLSGAITGSALTGEAPVPVGRSVPEMAADIPVTYVPARNLVFLALAASYAEAVAARDLFIGVNALDYSGYPDCRPAFIEAFRQTLHLGTKLGAEGGSWQVRTPLLNLTKAGIVALGLSLGTPFALTYSCYQGTQPACGVCDACLLRIKGFREARTRDPLPYAVPVSW